MVFFIHNSTRFAFNVNNFEQFSFNYSLYIFFIIHFRLPKLIEEDIHDSSKEPYCNSTLWRAKDYVNFIVKDVARPDLPEQGTLLFITFRLNIAQRCVLKKYFLVIIFFLHIFQTMWIEGPQPGCLGMILP